MPLFVLKSLNNCSFFWAEFRIFNCKTWRKIIFTYCDFKDLSTMHAMSVLPPGFFNLDTRWR